VEGKVERIKAYISKYKVCFGISLGIILGIAGPIFINMAYGATNKIFITVWDASDMLTYFGTLLGATATIIAVYATIKFSRESAEKDRRTSENNTYKNYGIQIIFDLLDLSSRKRVSDTINKAMELSIAIEGNCYNNSLAKELQYLEMCIVETFNRFYDFHQNIPQTTKEELWSFVKYFTKFLGEIKKYLLISGENSLPSDIPPDDVILLLNSHTDRYFSFQETMYDIIFTYDYSMKNAKKHTNLSSDN